jgi:hypothetical protein
MARLKSFDAHPPGGFQVLIPEIGMRKPETGSFTHCENFVMGVVRGNRFLAEKHSWNPSREWARAYVENQNVARCLAKPEYHHFLILDGEPAALPPRDIPDGGHSKKNVLADAVGAAKGVAAGVRVLLDWLGSGGKPVNQEVASGRALICASCPKNNGGDWKRVFTEPVANKIRAQLEIKHQMKLATAHDGALTVCSACDCPLPLKVWTPLEHILKFTEEDTAAKLDPRCWIIHEKQTRA